MLFRSDFSERELDPQNIGQSSLVNYQKLFSLLENTKYDDLRVNIELYANELSALGVIEVLHNRLDGPFIFRSKDVLR